MTRKGDFPGHVFRSRALAQIQGLLLFEFTVFLLLSTEVLLADASGRRFANAQESVSPSRPPEMQAQQPVPQQAASQQPQTQPAQTPVSNYDEALFQKRIPSDQLAFLSQFTGVAAQDVIRDKQFRKLMKSFVPDCMFHYGKDMSLLDALDMVFKGIDAAGPGA